jgi:hypothetical protein
MKHSFPVRCECGEELTLCTSGNNPFPYTTCPKCHSGICIVDDGLVSAKIFNKACAELHFGDFTLSIILSAMAVESELARVFVKWKEIDLGLPTDATEAARESWDKQLRGWGKIVCRLDRVCAFLTGSDFNVFVAAQDKLTKSVHERHPHTVGCRSLTKYFEKDLFWKRNLIMHLGKIDFGESDAKACRRAAETLFQVISEMDFGRRKRLAASTGGWLRSRGMGKC